MSLQVDESGRRGRSRSPGRRERSRSPGVPQIMEAREPSYAYPEDDLDGRDYERRRRRRDEPPAEPPTGGAVPYPEDEGMFPGGSSLYGGPPGGPGGPGGYDPRSAPYGRPVSPGADPNYYRGSRDQIPPPDDYRNPRDRFPDGPGGRPERESRRERKDEPPASPLDPDKLNFLPQKYARSSSRQPPEEREPDEDREKRRRDRDRDRYRDEDKGRERERDSDREKSRRDRYLGGEDEDRSERRRARSPRPDRPESPSAQYKYADQKPYEYAKVDGSRYGYEPKEDRPSDRPVSYGGGSFEDPRSRRGRDASPNPAARQQAPPPGYYPPGPGADPRLSNSNVLTVEPGADHRGSRRDRSPQPPTQRMSSLSVSNPHAPTAMTLAAAPGSPLLESYHGTYQDMSPMPSPLLLASNGGPGLAEPLSPISPVGSDDERGGRRRRARFNDAEDSATRIANALKGTKKDSPPDTAPLIEILPGMSHEQIMELRKEYKALVKTGADRKGVNVAKHIRSRLKDSDPHLMKACYSVALGQWESEAYWANFWYQGDKTRRELLIESLMGRTNDEIRQIKDSFQDRKYDNSLVNCMRTELKEDKFKKAVLMVLDERRMEDFDPHGRPIPPDLRLVDRDADDLRHAVKSEKGGESLMIGIIIQRSDAHLREVLKAYEHMYRGNFARDALKKSGNLVGELLAHILNGVINKPVRDALLLHHALTASKRDELRRELLTSRLVRFHWDARHMEAVKRAYRSRYGIDLQEAVREATSGEWGHFCYELCIYRMPNDVKRFERVQVMR